MNERMTTKSQLKIDNIKNTVIDAKKILLTDTSNSLKSIEDFNALIEKIVLEYDNSLKAEPIFAYKIKEELRKEMEYVFILKNLLSYYKKSLLNPEQISPDFFQVEFSYLRSVTIQKELGNKLHDYEKFSLKSGVHPDDIFHKAPQLVDTLNAEGKKKRVFDEYIDKYNKTVRLKKEVNQKVVSEYNTLNKIYEEFLKQLPPTKIEPYDTSFDTEDLSKTSKELSGQIEGILNELKTLENKEENKRKIHFYYTLDGKEYNMLLPMAKKPEIYKLVNELFKLENLKGRYYVEPLEFTNDLPLITIVDENILAMSHKQLNSYYQNIMLRIESQRPIVTTEVKDIFNENHSIDAIYYKTYIDCKQRLIDLDYTIDKNIINSLSPDELINYYRELIQRILGAPKTDADVVINSNGNTIPAVYYKDYNQCVKELDRLNIQSHELSTINEKDNKKEAGILVDEKQEKRSYYSNLMGNILNSGKKPTVKCEAFGKLWDVPSIYVFQFEEYKQELGKLVKMSSENLKIEDKQMNNPVLRIEDQQMNNPVLGIEETLRIDLKHVNSLNDLNQIFYYHEIMMKAVDSNLGPKVTKEFGGKTYEVPEKFSAIFDECTKQIIFIIEKMKQEIREEEKAKHPEPKKRFSIKNIRKATANIKQNVKKFLKNQKYKIIGIMTALGLGAALMGNVAVKNDLANEGIVSASEEKSTDENFLNDFVDNTKDAIAYATSSINMAPDYFVQEEDSYIDKITKQAGFSTFGSTFIPKENAKIYNDVSEINGPGVTPSYQKEVYAVVGMGLKMPDGSIRSVSYKNNDAQATLLELKSQGAEIISVSGVASKGEKDFSINELPTGTFKLSDINLADIKGTNLASQLYEMNNPEKGMSR